MCRKKTESKRNKRYISDKGHVQDRSSVHRARSVKEWQIPAVVRAQVRASVVRKKIKKKKEKMFIQINNIRYYNVYIHKLKLSIKYFNLNITVTSHAEKVSMFTSQISDTRLSLL